MALLDQRVQTLTNLLVEEGFPWLAAEIIGALEVGQTQEEPEFVLKSVRENLNNAEASADKARTPERIPLQRAARILSGEEQVKFAVDYMMSRLTDIAHSMEGAIDNLQSFAGGQVTLMSSFDGGLLPVSRDKITEAQGQIGNLRETFAQWLLNQGAP